MTECEIFLSLIIKFLDPDKPSWQRALALEILHRLLAQPLLVKSFCESYDMKPHATNIFQDTVNSLAACIQSLFVTTPPGQNATGSVDNLQHLSYLCVGRFYKFVVMLGAAGVTPMSSSSTATTNSNIVAPGVSPQAGFYYRGVWIPISTTFSSGQPKAIL